MTGRTDPLTDAMLDLVRQAVRDELAEVLVELRELTEARPPARYLTPIEAAKVAGVGLTKIREAYTSGKLASIRRGRSIRIPAEALDDWMQS